MHRFAFTLARAARRHARAGILACCALGALVPMAHGASTDLSDVPLSVQSGVKPNVLFILDNSQSMEWGSITGTDAAREYDNRRRAYYSPTFNRLYYNPAITYRPPVRYDASAPGFTRPMAAANPYAAPTDPFIGGRTVDLTRICWGSGSPPALPRSSSTFGASFTCADNPDLFRDTPYERFAFYFQWTGSGTEDGSSSQDNDSNYTEVLIDADFATYPKAATRTDCLGASVCTYTEELQNFANWFSYYRTRLQTAKTSLGLAFASLDDKLRVGFATINDNLGRENNNGSFFVALDDFGSTQKQRWFNQLYGIEPRGGTPLVEALDRAGRYYRSGRMAGTPGGARSQTVPLSCTPNYAILSTDGYWTSNDVSVGNTDDTVPPLPADVYNDPDTGLVRNDPVSGTPLVAGERFPAPFYGGSGSSNTLADVAMRHWISDMTGDSAGKVQANRSDPATWQHMTTYTIGLGASGTLSTPPTGSDGWPLPRESDPTAIDDLWHAALNGHGEYFNSPDPERLRTALGSILNDIVNRSGSASAVAVSNPNVQSGDNVAFTSTFNSGAWYGDLQAFAIDTSTGVLSATPLWSAQPGLDAKPFGSRLVASYDGAQGVPFTAAGLGAQADRLASPSSPPGPGDASAVMAYLRGDRSREGDGSNPAQPYRQRLHVLGDIVNAEASYVSAPRASYTDNGYSAYKGGPAATRTKVVYQGANDGMLHAFNADTGEEMWAYVPGALLREPLSASESGTSALVGLSQQSLFQHRYFVDATPTATDVDLSNTSQYRPVPPAPQWATVLVGGLGKGGRGYYALNVTAPSATTDAEVAAKAMWEFPNAATDATTRSNIGYTYGSPITIKTRAAGWVTLVTSGYNNGSSTGGDGRGRLFVLDTATGAVIRTLTTAAGSSSTPSGLARISAYLLSPGTDDTVDAVYGGDLLGNMWRFDLSGDTSSSWSVALLATLVDAQGNPQPVTEAPELGVVSGKRMVFVGTGRYLGASDIPGNPSANANATQRQSFYGLVDDRSAAPTILPLRSQLVAQSATPSNNGEINLSSNPVNLAVKRGWVLDLAPAPSGERSTTNPVLFAGILSFTTNTPASDPCSPGGSSNLYFLDYSTGGAQGDLVSRFVGNVLSSRVQPVGLPGGGAKILVRTSDGGTRTFNVAAPNSTTPTRVMWREVVRE
ncbi:PilC/PilY family type IV pilus protein [Variovorax dokdonensis]|uniref:PilC/PilY family type IV pilus protein n=1 Tax=Variovorax dokdonensis TaxID=344883 RepID=A0ABT7N9L2_9BURK|nr:PilC/PilY family type IV pilus protein [Variovorax dokdonensis]MDM0044636.1 PilC/PilY family type IV pilus protein [Variovorax dokdonensis]